jgi:replicative DNA helicase
MNTSENYFQDLTKEAALLGAILTHNDILDRYKIERGMFFEENHRLILDEIIHCRSRGSVANIQNIGMSLPGLAVQIATLTDYGISDISGCLDALRSCVRSRGVAMMIREIAELQGDLRPSGEVAEVAMKHIMGLAECHDVHYRPFNEVMASAVQEIADRRQNKNSISGVETGIDALDGWTDGFQPGDYIVIGARPSVGKTAFALAVARHAASKGSRVGFLSLEMSDTALMKRYLSAHANIPLNAIRTGLLSPAMMAALCNSGQELVNTPLFLADSPNMGISDLVAEARILRSREKIDVLIIDYIGLISAGSGNTPRWETFSVISQKIKSLARELKIPIVALSQLRREAEGKRPNLADLRESGGIEQDADVILFLHKEDKPAGNDGKEKIKVILAKQRNGQTGDIDLMFDKPRMRFYPVDYHVENRQYKD